MSKEIHLRILGMHCAGCVGAVEQALRAVPGVNAAAVQLLSESAHVRADESVSPERLIAAVRGVGYDARAEAPPRERLRELANETGVREALRRQRQNLIQAMMYVLPVLAVDHLRHVLWPASAASQVAARLMQFLLLLMLVRTAGGPILLGGLAALARRTPTMDSLISAGFLVAVLSSLYGTFVARDEAFVHLHAAAMLLGLTVLGRFLETRARTRSGAAMAALARRAVRPARVQRDGQFVETAIENINPGDLIQIPSGEPIPTDGQVVEGLGSVDERLMTGEAIPRRVASNDSVMGGSVLIEGILLLRATAEAAGSTLARIVQSVEEARASRTAMQALADRIAGVFTPLVFLLAVMTFSGWLVMHGSAADAMRAAVAVLVVACPCALGLATPTVVAVASGLAALRGILVRDAAMLEALGRVDTVVWDKTGTLTSGSAAVTAIEPAGGFDRLAILRSAAAAESVSTHPFAKAIVAQAKRESVVIPVPQDAEVVPGRGVIATVDGRRVTIGSRRFLIERGVSTFYDPESAETSPDSAARVAVAVDGAHAGWIALKDTVRPSSGEAVARLQRMNIQCELLTGDSAIAAMDIARKVGISATTAEVDPSQKAERIRALRARGRKVAMVGDGINDAVALASADVGVAFATGAQVACESAGVNLIGSTPELVVDAVRLARSSLRVIRQNLVWAFIYNVLMIPLAALGRLPPSLAAAAMMISSLTVVLNALRLQRIMRWPTDASKFPAERS